MVWQILACSSNTSLSIFIVSIILKYGLDVNLIDIFRGSSKGKDSKKGIRGL